MDERQNGLASERSYVNALDDVALIEEARKRTPATAQ
jgi:hypothetical protein